MTKLSFNLDLGFRVKGCGFGDKVSNFKNKNKY